ncbi:MAG: orotate phosphoribosyltransferase [Alicyclobacillus herbarius]|uniref:orotate phosphoribosyltransferase n=1 Tax=Alicyclobacillus herbarius TaxID=122960 RepID=UPI002351F970|nr:orotate phosphoribosyltransferase [Alicyclobacillus herbarius]MCL6632099.1 orotate phosphoribosyltransferase [Alicyclobacillus herbarius]
MTEYISQDAAKALARGLLQIRAVELRPHNPFTWSSGWKSPIYCDNRLLLGYPALRQAVVAGFEQLARTYVPGTEVVAGAATGGIAHAAWLADRLQLPMVYVRSSAKGHGQGRRVEGRLPQGARALVIEDTLSTGRSAYQVVDALKEEGAEVLGVFAIFSYGFQPVREHAERTGVSAWSLLDYDTLIEVALESGYIAPDDVTVLQAWRESPETFAQDV